MCFRVFYGFVSENVFEDVFGGLFFSLLLKGGFPEVFRGIRDIFAKMMMSDDYVLVPSV